MKRWTRKPNAAPTRPAPPPTAPAPLEGLVAQAERALGLLEGCRDEKAAAIARGDGDAAEVSGRELRQAAEETLALATAAEAQANQLLLRIRALGTRAVILNHSVKALLVPPAV